MSNKKQTEEVMSRDKRLTIQPKISADVYFRFKSMCHARKLAVEQVIEVLMIRELEKAGLSRK